MSHMHVAGAAISMYAKTNKEDVTMPRQSALRKGIRVSTYKYMAFRISSRREVLDRGLYKDRE